jgi:hypothetical protein
MRISGATSCKLASALLLAASLACADDPFQPTNETVVGDYDATQLRTSDVYGSVDWIALGARIDLRLYEDGTTSGRLFIPAGPGGIDEDQDLTGTWELRGENIWFRMVFDTFIDDMPWRAQRDRLIGDYTFVSGTRVRVVVEKVAH